MRLSRRPRDPPSCGNSGGPRQGCTRPAPWRSERRSHGGRFMRPAYPCLLDKTDGGPVYKAVCHARSQGRLTLPKRPASSGIARTGNSTFARLAGSQDGLAVIHRAASFGGQKVAARAECAPRQPSSAGARLGSWNRRRGGCAGVVRPPRRVGLTRAVWRRDHNRSGACAPTRLGCPARFDRSRIPSLRAQFCNAKAPQVVVMLAERARHLAIVFPRDRMDNFLDAAGAN